MGLPSIDIGLLIYESFLLAIANGAVVLRFLAKRIVARKLKLHDVLTVIALIGMMGYTIGTMIAAANFDYGYNEADVPPHTLTLALKSYFAVEPFWALSTVSFRIAILLLYVELFGLVKKMKLAANILIVIVALYGIACILAQMLNCKPINANWDINVQGKCGNQMASLSATAGINMVLDMVIVALPLPVVWKLHMSVRKKIGISLQFSIGLILVGVNIGRILLPALCGTVNTTYCAPGTFMLSATELAGGVCAACLPTLGPIIYGGGHGNGIFPTKNHETTPFSRNKLSSAASIPSPDGEELFGRYPRQQDDDLASDTTLRQAESKTEGSNSERSSGLNTAQDQHDSCTDPRAICVQRDYSVETGQLGDDQNGTLLR